MSEATRIEALARILGQGSLPNAAAALGAAAIEVGIGDDAAVLAPPTRGRVVVSVDEQVENVHFTRALVSPEDIGYRATMAAASDLAAMGALPWCAVSSIVVPDDVDDATLEAIARGQRAAADRVGFAIVGGNLARGPALSIATTVLGCAEAPLLRRGARAGDGIWLAGAVGLASLGFAALAAGNAARETEGARRAWLRPEARIADGRRAAPVAHAAIDVSDGLAKDLGAICVASGVVAHVDEAALARLADAWGATAAARALGPDVDPIRTMFVGGEDYALVVASDVPVDGFERIGTFREGAGRGEGPVFLVDARGEAHPVTGGFDHFDPSAKSRV